MHDIITHCPDTAALIAELAASHPEQLDDEGRHWAAIAGSKTPTVHHEGETLAYLRVTDAQRDIITTLDSIDIIAEAPYSGDAIASATALYARLIGPAADATSAAVYERVYPRTPISWTDEDGTEQSMTPPAWFGMVG